MCGVENPIGLKLKIYETEEGSIETNYTAPEHFQGYPGVLHGGIVAAILDEISGRALMGNSSTPRFMVTGKLEVKYRKRVPVGEPLRIIGKAGKSKGKIAEGWAGIYNSSGELLAEATALLIEVPQSLLSSADANTLGWGIYPD